MNVLNVISLVIFGFFKEIEPQALQTCTCVPRNTCFQNISTGSDLIDLRIVNTGIPTLPPTIPPTVAPGQCPVGTDTCCSGPAVTGCGLRYAITNANVVPAQGQIRYGAQPWQVIMYDLANNFIGGGALIDPSNVLTAAHKVLGRTPGTFKVRLGEWDVSRAVEPYEPQERVIAQVRIHPMFNQSIPLAQNNLQNNVAVLRLAQPITLNNPAINTICLPPSNATVYDGQRCIVAGWGKDSFTGTYQNIARDTEIPIVPWADCQNRLRTTRLGPFFNLDPISFICAGGEPLQDACTGDGGGALACIVGGRYQLAGLVAWGIGCGGNVPGVYVRVPSFLPWIQMQLTT